MPAAAMRKLSREGVGYSTVDAGDVRHVFVAAVPRHGETFCEQAADALNIIEAATHEEGACGAVVQQTVFLADSSLIAECRRLVHDYYGQEMPATSYIPQPPCMGKLLAIECMGVDQNHGDVEIRRHGERLVTVRRDGITWAHCAAADLQSQSSNVYDSSLRGLERIRTVLSTAGIPFQRVLRAWFYCGGITEREGDATNYQKMNRARADFYRGVRFLYGQIPHPNHGIMYPASTGIGVESRGVMLGAIALVAQRDDVAVVPLENPRQTPAYAYSLSFSPASPKFSRAVAVACDGRATIFISGTASITASETWHLGDAAAQTHETLDNIAALISEDNLRRHGLAGSGVSLDALAMARVYVKRQEDYATVRAVCRERLGEIPAIFAIADICRPELLVEIEGIAYS